jgi:hypothetical protein
VDQRDVTGLHPDDLARDTSIRCSAGRGDEGGELPIRADVAAVQRTARRLGEQYRQRNEVVALVQGPVDSAEVGELVQIPTTLRLFVVVSRWSAISVRSASTKAGRTP